MRVRAGVVGVHDDRDRRDRGRGLPERGSVVGFDVTLFGNPPSGVHVPASENDRSDLREARVRIDAPHGLVACPAVCDGPGALGQLDVTEEHHDAGGVVVSAFLSFVNVLRKALVHGPRP